MLRPVLLLWVWTSLTVTAAPDWTEVERVLRSRCYDCHGETKKKGGIDLLALADNPDVGANFETWIRVRETIEAGDMPPPKAEPLTPTERATVTGWVIRQLDRLAEQNAGDPGPVTMRRLTNAEYDRTLRDLTGRDYGLAARFQSDGGGGEGFSNTGDVLFLSPAALDKYLGAARQLAEHATIMPGTGITFHDHRIGLRGPEQLKAHAEQGLYVWYQQQAAPHLPKDFDAMREGDYMLACWKHRHFKTPLATLARDEGLKLPFLENWWTLLNSTSPESRFLDLTRARWRELPGPESAQPRGVPAAVQDRLAGIESDLLSWNNPRKPGSGVQRRQQDADGIRPYPMSLDVRGHSQVHLCFGDVGDGNAGDVALIRKIDVRIGRNTVNYLDWLDRQLKDLDSKPASNAEESIREERLEKLRSIREAFGRHPLPERKIEAGTLAITAPRILTLPLPTDATQLRVDTRLDLEHPQADSATIQWTLTTDSPPDVTRVMPGVLTIWKYGSPAQRKTMGEFNVMKQAFPDMFERRLEQVADNLYRSRPGITVYYFSDEQLAALLSETERNQLTAMKKDWRCTAPASLNASQRAEYDGAMIWHLHRFAGQAWRRPLSKAEQDGLEQLYRDGLDRGLDRESAAREVLVRVLVSPHFLFKTEILPATSAAATSSDQPLPPWELASRLSYFLWASMPDAELRRVAADGSLSQPEILEAQTRRMLKDHRADALAEEFAGQWLKFHDFQNHQDVDREAYPEFTPEIRADLHREAMEFFTRHFREDRPVRDIIAGETTFLNERLARFYGIPGVEGAAFREVKVADHHRGGLLGMGAILTKTSRPHRTSPVLRGDYLHQVVLGFTSPPPPPNVPQLQEKGLRPASLREALLRHRQDPACAVCHDRIDPLGFALESFDAIGRHRGTDPTGAPIDDTGELRDGTRLSGISGLRDHLASNTGPFIGQFCRKLLGYALGRTVLPSDRQLLTRMSEALSADAGRTSAAVLEIVKSRQFLNRRMDGIVASHEPQTSNP